MKIKVSEATPRQLNYLVAKCESTKNQPHDDYYWRSMFQSWGFYEDGFNYSTDWAQGGPITWREKINVGWNDALQPVAWQGAVSDYDTVPMFYGPTTLIAAVRCYVEHELGAEVEVPEELV